MRDQPAAVHDQKIRILILDHHLLVRQGIRLMIESQPGLEVVGEAGTRADALAITQQLASLDQLDIILLDLNLDDEPDPGIIVALLDVAPTAKIILVSAFNDTSLQRQAVHAGVMGILTKQDHQDVLIKAIQKVYMGEVWIDRSMMANVLLRFRQQGGDEPEDPDELAIQQLSFREKEVIELIGEGLKNKDIADRLSISEFTVRHHLTSIYSKLDVNDRLELLIFAYRCKLIELPT